MKFEFCVPQIEKSSPRDQSDSRHRNYGIIMYESVIFEFLMGIFLYLGRHLPLHYFCLAKICGRITSQPEFRNYSPSANDDEHQMDYVKFQNKLSEKRCRRNRNAVPVKSNA